MRWTIPNILTVLRLIAAPGLLLVYELLPRPWSDWVALFLFVAAALTDYFDGILARRWKQISAFGRMLDPIADKAMTIIALLMLSVLLNGGNRGFFIAEQDVSLFGLVRFHMPQIAVFGDWLILAPAVMILFREVFISGLREFIGADKGSLAVTRLAKWKTAAQMLAITVLFTNLLFEHYFVINSFAMERDFVRDVLAGREADMFGLRWKYAGYIWSFNIGVVLIWGAGIVTLVTGYDYFRKALPYLKEDEQ